MIGNQKSIIILLMIWKDIRVPGVMWSGPGEDRERLTVPCVMLMKIRYHSFI